MIGGSGWVRASVSGMAALRSVYVRVVLYTAAVAGVTAVHDPGLLLALLAGLLVVMGRREGLLLMRRAVWALAAVNGTVSLGYGAMAAWQGAPWLEVVVRLNARALLLTLLTLWLARRVDWRRGLAAWPGLRLLVTIAEAQISALQRVVEQYRLGRRSRAGRPAGPRARYQGAAHQVAGLVDRAERRSEELTEGMRSRGALHDRA